MRFTTGIVMVMLGLSGAALAQGNGAGAPPAAIGNRANGLSYQPTPAEVVPRERAAGVAAPPGQLNANDRSLEKIDRNLLHSEGQSTSSVPSFSTNH